MSGGWPELLRPGTDAVGFAFHQRASLFHRRLRGILEEAERLGAEKNSQAEGRVRSSHLYSEFPFERKLAKNSKLGPALATDTCRRTPRGWKPPTVRGKGRGGGGLREVETSSPTAKLDVCKTLRTCAGAGSGCSWRRHRRTNC